MTIAEIIQPGDKVDISFVQNVERAKKDQSMPKIYKSQVLDLKENGNLEISMPVERGKLVLLPLGIRMEFIFFSKGTLYRAVGQVRERYKRECIHVRDRIKIPDLQVSEKRILPVSMYYGHELLHH